MQLSRRNLVAGTLTNSSTTFLKRRGSMAYSYFGNYSERKMFNWIKQQIQAMWSACSARLERKEGKKRWQCQMGQILPDSIFQVLHCFHVKVPFSVQSLKKVCICNIFFSLYFDSFKINFCLYIFCLNLLVLEDFSKCLNLHQTLDYGT